MVRPDSSDRLTLEQEREIDRLCLAFEERARLADARIAAPAVPEGLRIAWVHPAEGPDPETGAVVLPAGEPLVFALEPDR